MLDLLSSTYISGEKDGSQIEKLDFIQYYNKIEGGFDMMDEMVCGLYSFIVNYYFP